MYHEVDIRKTTNGRHKVIRLSHSVGWPSANDLAAELRENCDGLCELGVDPLPIGAVDIRDKIEGKVERVFCFTVPGKGVQYVGIKHYPEVTLHLIKN